MQEGEKKYKGKVEITDREKLVIDGVMSVLTFDEGYLLIKTSTCNIFVDGSGLSIVDLSKETNKLIITGLINTVGFEESKNKIRRKG